MWKLFELLQGEFLDAAQAAATKESLIEIGNVESAKFVTKLGGVVLATV